MADVDQQQQQEERLDQQDQVPQVNGGEENGGEEVDPNANKVIIGMFRSDSECLFRFSFHFLPHSLTCNRHSQVVQREEWLWIHFSQRQRRRRCLRSPGRQRYHSFLFYGKSGDDEFFYNPGFFPSKKMNQHFFPLCLIRLSHTNWVLYLFPSHSRLSSATIHPKLCAAWAMERWSSLTSWKAKR